MPQSDRGSLRLRGYKLVLLKLFDSSDLLDSIWR